MAVISLAVIAVAITMHVVLKKIESYQKNKAFASASKLPGPKGLPLIGNVHELPEKCSWMKFAEWADEHGPIYQVNLAGENHVWISRDKIAHDLLSKRSAIYSDRPYIPALEHDNRTSGQYLPLMSKNLVWSRQRRFAKQIMDASEKQNFYSYPEIESTRLLFEMMSDPSQYNVAMESFVARVTCRLAWGTPVASDELKQRARELLIGVSPTGALGNKIPAVMSLPENMSKSKAWELRRGRTEKKFFEVMQDQVRQTMEREEGVSTPLLPTVQPSWTRMYLEHAKSWGFSSDTEGAYAVGMHGIAGALTVAAPMQSFCLAMCHYPQYQSILHEEIDRVLGDRMPTFEDMPDMPVLRAFIRETLRWRPPVPTGIPHALIQDDVYEGYHIPKGSVIHPLEWSISRDPEVFPEPDEWNPTRWLHSDYPTYQEPLTRYPTITQYSQFGYGRRTCQGMGVTEADLFVGLGSIAWLFSMEATDETGVKAEESQPEPQPQAAEVESDATVDDTFSEIDSIAAPSTPMSRRSTFSSHETPADLISFDNEAAGDWSPSIEPKRLSMHLNDSAISLFSADYPASESTHSHSRQSTLQTQLSMHDNDSAISVASFASDGESSFEMSRKQRPQRPRLVPKDSGISMSSFIAQRESRPPSSRKSTLKPRPTSLRINNSQSVSSLISEMHTASTSRQNSVYTPGSALSLLSEMADEQGGIPRRHSMHFPEPEPESPKDDSNIRVAGEWPGLSTDPEKEYVDLFGPLIDEPEPALPPVDGPTLTPNLPGAWNFAKVDAVKEAPRPKKQAPLYETDPTMNFSTLLIAKPMPFKFKLSIRNQARAEMVAKQWIDKRLEGEYQDSKVYWKNGVQGDSEHGWGETFS
ncbi:hypothetical protein PRZ48_002050 [Zasmidium cellare]|uniref:Cytochrome P450 n=1 Tax=Zasmidium cellare TaxID=395010 RepID=A0ABR0F3P2_ZASCE|nr:hypothetical protein PRZ48_002050 [Zasmidium cellare]